MEDCFTDQQYYQTIQSPNVLDGCTGYTRLKACIQIYLCNEQSVPPAVVTLSLVEHARWDVLKCFLWKASRLLAPMQRPYSVRPTQLWLCSSHAALLSWIDASSSLHTITHPLSRIHAELEMRWSNNFGDDRLPAIFIGRACRQSISASGRLICFARVWNIDLDANHPVTCMTRFHEPAHTAPVVARANTQSCKST